MHRTPATIRARQSWTLALFVAAATQWSQTPLFAQPPPRGSPAATTATTATGAADAPGAADASGAAVGGLAAPCDGATVTRVDVRSYPPSYNGKALATYESLERAVGVSHTSTRERVVLAYLLLRPGSACTERDRSESERLLRALPFLSAASVRVIGDGAGVVRVQVDVVDEIALTGSVQVARGSLSYLAIGSQNAAGLGIGVELSFTNGFAYRNGVGLELAQHGAFGAPIEIAAAARRDPLGELLSLTLGAPFITDVQRRAFHIGALEANDYYGLARPAGPDVSLTVRRTAYDAGWVARVGARQRNGIIGVLGAAVMGEDIHVGKRTTIVSDTGLISAPDSALESRYPPYAVMRLAGVAGVRAVHFETVRGFDALSAEQDVAHGVQVTMLAGPSVWASRMTNDVFVSADGYWGGGGQHSLAALHVLAEGRANYASHRWDGVVAHARFWWRLVPSEGISRLLRVEASAVQHLAFPFQLTMRDAEGGLPGYEGPTGAGGQRLVVRLEERHLLPNVSRRVDLAVAAVVSAGKLWSGDVPFGANTPMRASAGVSLLGAWPRGGKRTLRADVSFPFQPVPGQPRVEFRVSILDVTRTFGFEPRDVAVARSASVPTNLVRW